jgi:hypothetical protein
MVGDSQPACILNGRNWKTVMSDSNDKSNMPPGNKRFSCGYLIACGMVAVIAQGLVDGGMFFAQHVCAVQLGRSIELLAIGIVTGILLLILNILFDRYTDRKNDREEP